MIKCTMIHKNIQNKLVWYSPFQTSEVCLNSTQYVQEVSNRMVLNFIRSAKMHAASLAPPQYFDDENTVSSFPFS